MSVAEAPVAVEDPEPLHRRLGVTDDELVAIRERLGGRDAERSRARDVQRDVERALLVQELAAAPPDAADRHGRGRRRRRAGRERRRDLDRRRARGRVQDRVPQPPERGRADPGRRDRRRRHPPRHLHDGRPAGRRPGRPPVRRPGRPADAAPRRGRRRRASAATATASASRRSAASSSSTRRTRATRSSTSWRSACSRSAT